MVLNGRLRVHVAQPNDRADRHDARVDVASVDDARVEEPLLELGDLVLEHRLLVLRVVVLRVLGNVAECPRHANAIRDFAAPVGAQDRELLLQVFVALRREDHVLHTASRQHFGTKRGAECATPGREW